MNILYTIFMFIIIGGVSLIGVLLYERIFDFDINKKLRIIVFSLIVIVSLSASILVGIEKHNTEYKEQTITILNQNGNIITSYEKVRDIQRYNDRLSFIENNNLTTIYMGTSTIIIKENNE